MISTGQHVKAMWTDGQYYGARVREFNGSHYLVAWDDGSPELWVSADQVQIEGGGGFATGQHVSAQWTNGSWYGARVVQQSGDQIEVAWDDGSPNLWLAAHQVKSDAGSDGFATGQHVSAQWTNGSWYGARVVQQSGDQIEVAWDDGSPNLWLAAHQVKSDAAAEAPSAGGALEAGAHVQAIWTDGAWYGARIVRVRGPHFEVAWDDGSPNLWVSSNKIRLG